MSICIATWNINSIRIRLELLAETIKNNNIDVLMLQETKCQDKDFPETAISEMGMNYTYKGQKSYNGVAILSKFPLDLEMTELPLYSLQDKDDEARYIEATTTIEGKIYRFASVYVPMGGSILEPGQTLEESSRFQYKLNFYKRLQYRLDEIKANSDNFTDEYVIFGGDFNVAQEAIDLAHPKENEGGVGFHPLERQALRDMRSVGVKDVFRELHPNDIQYTWWDYRTRAFERNVGWRLDYLFASPNLLSHIRSCEVDMQTRAKQKTSDHACSKINV